MVTKALSVLGNPYKLFSTSRTSIPSMNANDDEQNLINIQQRSLSTSNYSNHGRTIDSGFDFNQNGIPDSDQSDNERNGNNIRQFHQSRSTISKTNKLQNMPMAWDTSVSNWIEQSGKGKHFLFSKMINNISSFET